MVRTQSLLIFVFSVFRSLEPVSLTGRTRLVAGLPLIALSFSATSVFAQRATPCVQFDVVQTVTATDVSTPEFLAANPTDKLIGIKLPISSLAQLQSEGSLLQYLYVISGTTASPFQVVDYAPRTTLYSDTDGLVSVEESRSSATNLGIKALTPGDFPLKGDALANHNSSSSNASRSQRLPPRQLLAASGTMHRGVSAYFKLKATTQTTLEGDKTFEIVAQVPKSWRAGLVHVRCTAFGRLRDAAMVGSPNLVCSRASFVVGVSMQGDEQAKRSVRNLAATQRWLKYLAQVQSEHVQQRRYSGWGHKLGTALSISKPRIPDGWLDEILTAADDPTFEDYLPLEIQNAAAKYRQARQQVLDFAG